MKHKRFSFSDFPIPAPDNYLRKCGAEVSEVVDPVLKPLGMNFFSYSRFYWNKTTFALCSRQDWLDHYYEAKLYEDIMDGVPIIKASGYYCADDFPTQDNGYGVVREHMRQFSIHHVCFIHRHYIGHTEVAMFGAPKEFSEFNRCFLFNKAQFYRFISYFKSNGKHLINRAKDELYPFQYDHPEETPNSLDVFGTKFNRLLKNANIDRVYLNSVNEEIYLTQREIDCLRLLTQNLNYHQIAKKLDISRHTVQLHINNIRDKLKCTNKKELLDTVKSHNLLDEIDSDVELRATPDEVERMSTLYEDYIKSFK